MQLLLFDIDGTLLRANGSGRTAIKQAISTVTGQEVSTAEVAFSGRTDPTIFRDVLRTNGLPVHDHLVSKVLDAYVETAQNIIQPNTVDRLPGTDSLLSRLAPRPDVFLGLVTGNVESVAYQKLQSAHLDGYFSVGAFGSDHANRSRLPTLATNRAENTVGQCFSPTQTVVIGDTIRDIECARDTGAHAVVVSTGRPDHADLASSNPDLLLENFRNPKDIVSRIVNL